MDQSLVKNTLGAVLFGLAIFHTQPSQSEEKAALVGAELGTWTMDFDAAAKLAGEKKVPLLLNFTGSDWCHWCIHMDKTVFAKDDWKSYAKDNLVLVTLDFPRNSVAIPENYQKRNQELQAKYQVRGYPTYLILDSDAETVLGQLGAGQDVTPSQFVKQCQTAIRLSETQIAAFSEANPDKAEAYKAAISALKTTEDEFKEWLATRPVRNDENEKIFNGFQERMKEADAKIASFHE